MTDVAVIDFGGGNLYNVVGGLRRAGGRPRRAREPRELRAADCLVLPGVASFDAIARGVRPFRRALERAREEEVPILGICAGAQFLYGGSDEGRERGLGWLPGSVRRLRATVLPHVGWGRLEILRPDRLFDRIPNHSAVYFAHSFAAPADGPSVVATATHGEAFAAVARSGGVAGVQFHPERSGRVGQRMLENFLAEAT